MQNRRGNSSPDVFGQPAKMEAYPCDAVKVVVKGAFALAIDRELLLKGGFDFLKTIDAGQGFFYSGWSACFFS